MLKKLASGEYSLKATFWVFGLLGMFFFNIVANITHNGVLRGLCKGRTCAKNLILAILENLPNLITSANGGLSVLSVHLFISACFVCYMILLVRGLWKSAAAYEGSKFWSFSAKFIVICMVLLSLKSII